jgi:hypothetical protein
MRQYEFLIRSLLEEESAPLVLWFISVLKD